MPIAILSAGAGSGKTYTLTERMVALIGQGVRPSGIVATTFTQKAAAELYERVRTRLLRAGMREAAHELGGALIGTVHSIGARLLQRFAFEIGASPRVEAIAESDAQRLFNESLAQVLDETRTAEMNHLADCLGLTKKNAENAYDWRGDIRRICEAARANMLTPEALQLSRQRSIETFDALLPPLSNQTAAKWNEQLASLLHQTIEALENNTADDTKTTRDAVEELRSWRTALQQRGFLYWHEWAKMSKTRVAAKSRELFAPLQQLAQSHGAHPDFRAQIHAYIGLAFDIAADAIAEYQRYKRKRGLIDYADMEAQVAQLLRLPAVRDTLSEEIDLLLVDEFQDTSPIQLDIFLQLSQLARQAIWVGDPKQSIYGFRGADPALMHAVVEATGGIRPENILQKSWRSRSDLVYFTNALFTQVFSHLPVEQVALQPALPIEKYTHPDAPPALLHWHFLNQADHRKVPAQPWTSCVIARQVHALLEHPIPVWTKNRERTRPLRAGDIAVLCRDNAKCQQMADALHRVGVRASVARSGLLQTAEGRLVVACLKYLINPRDALSAAEVLVLSGAQTVEEIVQHRLATLNEAHADNREPERHPILSHLSRLRPQIADLSTTEVLHRLFAELHLPHIVVRRGNASRRIDNLDQLRYYASEYEAFCQRMQAGASLGGFLLWLDALAEANADLQGSGEDPDTVRVMTYHRSKGLEFPVVICTQLEARAKDTLWGCTVLSERERPDLDRILADRWVRFWINPYADQWQKTDLAEALQQTDLWQRALQQSRDEEARLLYVGLTRARDYLILPTTAKGTPWLSRVLYGDESTPLLDPANEILPLEWQGQPIRCQTITFYEPPSLPDPQPPLQERSYYFKRPSGRSAVPVSDLWIDPSATAPPASAIHWSAPSPIAPPLEIKSEHRAAVARALQAFVVAAHPTLSAQQREHLAHRILCAEEALEYLSPAALVRHAEAFHRWMDVPSTSTLTAAFPVEGQIGQRRIRLEIDVFWEKDNQLYACFFADAVETSAKNKSAEPPKAVTHKASWARYLLQQHSTKSALCWAVFPIEGIAMQAE